MAESKLTALTETSVPVLTDLTYSIADPGGSPLDRKLTFARMGGLIYHGPPMGRLTTEDDVPISTSDQTAVGTLYWTPCTSSGIALTNGYVRTYDGTRIKVQEASQVSLAMSITSGKNYDVFLKNSDLSLVLSAAWTTDTARADAITSVKDLVVATADNTYLWLGTIRASGTNTIEDSMAKRFVWNAYNQVPRVHKNTIESTNTWDYTLLTWRQARATATNQFEYVTGDNGTYLEATVNGAANNTNATAVNVATGVGIDSTSVNSGFGFGACCPGAALFSGFPVSTYKGYPGLGYHFITWLEISAATGTTTWVGDAGLTIFQTGIHGTSLG